MQHNEWRADETPKKNSPLSTIEQLRAGKECAGTIFLFPYFPAPVQFQRRRRGILPTTHGKRSHTLSWTIGWSTHSHLRQLTRPLFDEINLCAEQHVRREYVIQRSRDGIPGARPGHELRDPALSRVVQPRAQQQPNHVVADPEGEQRAERRERRVSRSALDVLRVGRGDKPVDQ